MGLRVKITLLLLLLVLPVLGVFSWVRFGAEGEQRRAHHVERVVAKFGRRPEALCRPRALPKRALRRAGVRAIGTYDAAWRARQPGAGDVPEHVRRLWAVRLANGEDELMHVPGVQGGMTVADRGEGVPEACRVMVVWWGRGDGRLERQVRHVVMQQVVVLTLVLLATGGLVSLPLIRRIRQLKRHIIKASAKTGWRLPHGWGDSADELGQLARAFEQTGQRLEQGVKELEQRDKALKEYLANTTHDLAIPLTVLQHRLRRVATAVEGEQAPRLEDIHAALEESHYIGALIANMAAAAKLEAGHQEVMHEVEMGALVERVIGRHEPIAHAKGVALGWGVPMAKMKAWGDSILLEQALSNLVQNALQYNQEGGHVAVVLEEREQGFELRVQDDGPGAPPTLLDTLAARNVRGDEARSRNPGGQGFGLSIVAAVCEVHGFTLAFENAGPDGGFVARIKGKAVFDQ